jgi:hypothetical protein
MSSAELDDADYHPTWLVKRVLVAGQPAVLGGPRKSLKTSVSIDLALALGNSGGGRFLGEFDVPEAVPVGFWTGESGGFTVQETARRVCKAHGYDLRKSLVHWSYELPGLGREEDLAGLAEEVRRLGLKVVIIDPLYLCLTIGGGEVDTKNINSVGPRLRRLAEACLDGGATPVLNHHARKPRERESRFAPLDLDELAHSGTAEFARQWLLLSPMREYEDGSGRHDLWLKVGGSAGISSIWSVTVDQKTVDDDFRGRRWDVKVRPGSEGLDQLKAEKEQARLRKGSERAAADSGGLKEAMAGQEIWYTRRELCGLLGWGDPRVRKALKALEERLEVVVRSMDRHGNRCDHYALKDRVPSPVEEPDAAAVAA